MRCVVSLVVLLGGNLAVAGKGPSKAQPEDKASAGWTASFGAEATGSYLDAEGLRLVVVSAGDELDAARSASAALREALRQSNRTKLVMDDKALGAVAALGDSEIVKKAATLPVDRVAVVRVFAGAAAPSAVVTVYGKDGAVLSALNVEEGSALARQAPASGVAPQAQIAVGALVGSSEEAEEEFEKRAVWFQDFGAFDARSGAMVASWSEPKKGKYGEPLEGADFYAYVGRPDLAEQYRAAEEENASDFRTGGLVSLAGIGFMVAGPFILPKSCDETGDYCSRRIALPLIGGSLLMTGGLLYMLGSWDNPHPVQEHEAREIADKYNEKLKAELGLRAEAEPAPTSQEPRLDVAAAPFIMPGGAGFALGVRF